MTVQQLVNLALRDLEVVYSGQTPSSDQSNDAFSTLNEILANWSQEGLLVPTHAVTQFALSSGTNAYTMGVGASWVTTGLPIKIKGAIASRLGFQEGLEILAMQDFERSISNGLGRTTALPTKLGYDDAAPLRNVRLWPTPNDSSAVIEISYWIPLTPFSALGDTVAFALPAFEQAVRNELMLRLAFMFRVPTTPAMAAAAQQSRLALTRVEPAEATDAPTAPELAPATQPPMVTRPAA